MSENKRCWMNGRLLTRAAATVSVYDHGLLYGDGVFEGIRFYHGTPFRLAAHLRRLRRSAAALRLTIPYDDASLGAACAEVIACSGLRDGYLRLLVTRGEGPLGLNPLACGTPNVVLIADDITLVDAAARARGIRAIVAATRRLGADGLDPRIKSLNYLNHILARLEAANAGADEAILLNQAGHVAEGSADNVFIVRDGVLLTPPPSDGALEGITRGVLLELASAAGIPWREQSLAPFDLHTADECFLTGTAAELIPVRDIDGRAMGACPGPVAQRLQAAFHGLVRAECAAPAVIASA